MSTSVPGIWQAVCDDQRKIDELRHLPDGRWIQFSGWENDPSPTSLGGWGNWPPRRTVSEATLSPELAYAWFIKNKKEKEIPDELNYLQPAAEPPQPESLESLSIPPKAPALPNRLEIQRNNWIVRENGSGKQISDRLRERIAAGNRIDPKPDYALWKPVGKNQVNEIKKTWTFQDEPPTD
jgi:hypothetical protein